MAKRPDCAMTSIANMSHPDRANMLHWFSHEYKQNLSTRHTWVHDNHRIRVTKNKLKNLKSIFAVIMNIEMCRQMDSPG